MTCPNCLSSAARPVLVEGGDPSVSYFRCETCGCEWSEQDAGTDHAQVAIMKTGHENPPDVWASA